MQHPDFRYPVQWIDRWPVADGTAITVRPVLPQDEALQRDFFTHQLTGRSRYQRFMVGMRELPASTAHYLTRIDYHDHFALVAETFDARGHRLVGDARFVRVDGRPQAAEFALAIADTWQGQGLGRRLLQLLVSAAQTHGVRELLGDVMRDNAPMLQLARSSGFALARHPDDGRLLRVTRALALAPHGTSANDAAWVKSGGPGLAGSKPMGNLPTGQGRHLSTEIRR